jgi:tryptophan halogenase
MNNKKIKNIVIVGGGTAGWMTALYAKKALPHSSIVLVESEDIGILGAGEGTTPHFVDFLDFLEIPISRLVKETGTTIKNGIKFTNWNNDGEHYYHPFKVFNGLGLDSANISAYLSNTNSGILANVHSEDKYSDFEFIDKVSEKCKVPFQFNGNKKEDVQNSIYCFNQLSSFGIHFDARLVAKLLSEIAIERGIVRIEGKVVDVICSENNDVTSIVLDNKSVLETDFIFDASGFHRVIIDKIYNAKWVSHSDKLPVDSAIPFFIEQDENSIPAYTESIAMKYGWMWKIPLQHRFGCGYVYDSSLISEKEAIQEIESYLGFEPTYPRKDKGGFKFSAGYYETPWVNNCVAVGLSAGFLEPLEATSLWTTIVTLTNTFMDLQLMVNRDQRYIDEFNAKYSKMTQDIVDFIYFHYMSDRKDTDFWKKFTKDNAPEFVKDSLNKWEYKSPEYTDFSTHSFCLESWTAISLGIKQADIEVMKNSYEVNYLSERMSYLYESVKKAQDDATVLCMDHKDFLEALK